MPDFLTFIESVNYLESRQELFSHRVTKIPQLGYKSKWARYFQKILPDAETSGIVPENSTIVFKFEAI